ncbi:MAG TPA: helix-turn-helix transcriptional regulator [Candidatus Saccharimonadales bacterium]|nr:helix-turn-helix transcriptional regulator [Candidatus Saccharimonadales bacterium]
MRKSLQKSAKHIRRKLGEHKGILDPINAAQHFQLNRYLPSPYLAPFVEHYWIIRWDLKGRQPYVSEVLPYPNINLAFTKDQAWITGVTTGKYDYEVKNAGVIVGVMFKPGAFYAFWPHSMASLTDKTMPVIEVFPEADGDFRRELLALSDDKQIVVEIEELLHTKQPALDQSIRLITKIIVTVTSDKDLLTVQAVAKQFNMSERTLQHLFQTYVGAGLKWIIMRYRLQEAAEVAAKQETPNWTVIAAELGYSDQSHFANDFKRVIGKSPSSYNKSLHKRSIN